MLNANTFYIKLAKLVKLVKLVNTGNTHHEIGQARNHTLFCHHNKRL
jgi:hypothetical protein